MKTPLHFRTSPGFNLLLVCSVLFLVVLGCGAPPETSKETPPKPVAVSKSPEAQAIAVKATDLTKAYDANEVAADGQYKGKKLEVFGKIKSISETLGSMQVDLEGH